MTLATHIAVPAQMHPRYWARVIPLYLENISAYWRDAYTLPDFLRVMRVRLSQSKIGRLVCPSPITARIRLRTFGAEVLHVRSHTTDISVLNEILVSGGYDALIRHPRPAPALIVDLGANIGLVDRWLLNRYPNARVVAVEPQPGNATTLRANVEGLPVEVVEAAIGATCRTVRLHTSSGEHGFTMVGQAVAGAETFEVPVVTMASIIGSSEPIGLLKVDIEGAEEELFSDCSTWIGRVKMLLVECHGHYKIHNLQADLERAGGRFCLLDEELKPEWGFEVALLEQGDRH